MYTAWFAYMEERGFQNMALLGVSRENANDIVKEQALRDCKKENGKGKFDVYYIDLSLRECCEGFLKNAKKYDAVLCTNDVVAIVLGSMLKKLENDFDFCYKGIKCGEAEGNISVYDMQYELYSAPCLNAAYIELCEKENTVPVTVEFAEESTLYGVDCHEFIIDDSEYMSRLVFRANETIKNVSFNSLRYEGSNYFVDEQLYTLPELVSQKPLVAGVVFYGDMTTYGLSFTDAVGNIRNFYICISGKDGSLIMAEYNNSEN
jgi:hypothetical protein